MERRPGRRRRGALSGVVLALAACSSESPAVGQTPQPPPEDDRLLVLPELRPCEPGATSPSTIRVATWNMAAARLAPLSKAEQLLASLEADAIVLQEVDVGVARTGSVDQPRILAEALGMEHVFAASLEFDGGDFGLAALSRLPFAKAQRVSLDSEGGFEARIALDLTLCAGSVPVRVLDLHADFVPEVNLRNLDDMVQVVGTPHGSTVVAGDFNAGPDSPGVKRLVEGTGFVDVFATRDPAPTHINGRIDFMLVDPEQAESIPRVMRVENDASDHDALWIELALP